MQDLKLTTMNDVFRLATGRDGKTAMLYKQGREWKPITSAELYGRVRAMADILRGWGVSRGDRVVLISENRWEWQVMDFAALALGAVGVPLYPTLTPEQLGYMLRDSAAKVAVLSTRQQYDKLVQAGEFADLEHVVVMDEGEFPGADSFAKLMDGAEGKQSPDETFDKNVAEAKPDDLATIIYTSGTTGDPKGVMLTHGNLASNLLYSTTPFEFGDADACISFLPLSHVTARHLDYALLARGATVAYCPKVDYLKDAMMQVKPTIFVAVPRVYEKVRQGVEGKATDMKAKILAWALKTGKMNREKTLCGEAPHGLAAKLADKLIYSKLRAAFGGQVRIFVSGGAPLGMESASWFADMGIRIFEGYGLTETSPVIALNYPQAHRIGSVGKVLKNVEVRFAEDAELEVYGPSIFKSYWKKEKETAEALTADGWFKTGDIGKLDADKFLCITDRKKELIKTSGGKFVAPQPIENKLKANSLIAHAAMVGDKRKFVSVLLSPNFDALTAWAKAQGVNTGDRAMMMKDAKVIAVYKSIVDKVNQELAHFEAIKKIAVVADEWSVEDGMLTPSMKLKRRMVMQRYKKEIDGFYGGNSGEDTSAGEESKK